MSGDLKARRRNWDRLSEAGRKRWADDALAEIRTLSFALTEQKHDPAQRRPVWVFDGKPVTVGQKAAAVSFALLGPVLIVCTVIVPVLGFLLVIWVGVLLALMVQVDKREVTR